jgi:S1-C subfamily serine protease
MLDFTSSFDEREPVETSGAEAAPPVADTELLDAYSHAVISVADAVGPAVLRVETRGANGKPGGVGSGVTIAPDGLVLTNCHVVEGAKEIQLRDSEGRVMEARSLGVDPDTDLALLRAGSVRDLPHAPLGDSKKLKRGQMAIAIGNPLGFESTVTAVIMGAQGICFAVASNTAQFVLSELIKHGRVRRGYIGVSGQTTAVPRRHARNAGIENASGAMVTGLEPNGPAAKAGLMSLDTIVRADGVPVTGVDDLIRVLNGERIGRAIAIDVLRRGTLRMFEVKPLERPAVKAA